MKQNYQTGEIINVDFGKPPIEVKGHEQGLNRPCVIIKSFNNMRLAVVVPITSTTPKISYYTIVKLSKGTGNLIYDSYALCHQIRTISIDDRVKNKIGKLDLIDLMKIKTVLLDTLEL